MTRGTSLHERITPNHLGEMMRLYRTVNQRDLRTLAAEIGIGHATLMRIEHGQAFDAETLLKLWQWFLTKQESK